MRITRVYTKTGDQGKTRLAGGQEVSKADPRLEAYGTVDELNSWLGVLRAWLKEAPGPEAARLDAELKVAQHVLFDAGALLATPSGSSLPNLPVIPEERLTRLEAFIDECQEALGPLTEFILPGGGKIAAVLHVARTVCRRAERACVGLAAEDPGVNPMVVKYLNRLSDALFVWARWMSKVQGEPEFLWERGVKT